MRMITIQSFNLFLILGLLIDPDYIEILVNSKVFVHNRNISLRSPDNCYLNNRSKYRKSKWDI